MSFWSDWGYDVPDDFYECCPEDEIYDLSYWLTVEEMNELEDDNDSRTCEHSE